MFLAEEEQTNRDLQRLIGNGLVLHELVGVAILLDELLNEFYIVDVQKVQVARELVGEEVSEGQCFQWLRRGSR